MDPVKVAKATGIYGAPRGHEDEVGGLPYWREQESLGGRVYSVVRSAWRPTPEELQALRDGAYVVLGIHGMEPIPPVSLHVAFMEDGAAPQEEVQST